MQLIAFTATVFYYLGYATWKVAAAQMEPLHGTRPVRIFVAATGNLLWWAGLLVTLVGVVMQTAALAKLPLAEAAPLFTASLGFLLLIAIAGFGERLTVREWTCLALVAAAMVLVALTVGDVTVGRSIPVAAVLSTALASLVVPVLLFTVGDTRREGRHARPIAGVAYGIGIGMVAGTSELMIKAISGVWSTGRTIVEIAATPYPWVLVVTAIVSWGMTQIALQRARLAIVISVGTIIAQTHLLLTGSLIYGETWPSDPADQLVRGVALVLALGAVLLFPRQEVSS